MRQEEAGIANLTNASSCRPVPGLQFLVTAVTNYDLPAQCAEHTLSSKLLCDDYMSSSEELQLCIFQNLQLD